MLVTSGLALMIVIGGQERRDIVCGFMRDNQSRGMCTAD